MSVAYYISAHGFGHFVRSAQVIKALPTEVPVIVRSMIPSWFMDQELADVKYECAPAQFDVGAVGADSIQVDIEKTFELAREIHEQGVHEIEAEKNFLRSCKAKLVVCDAPAVPLLAAKSLGIPSVVIANFTWVEIYESLADQAEAQGLADLAEIGRNVIGNYRDAYAAGDLLLVPGLNMKMGACRRQCEVPIISRHGRPDRAALCEALGFDAERPIYQVYLGAAGYAGMQWERLAEFPEAQLFSFTPVVDETAGRIKVLAADRIDHADATASIDAVIGKVGYSLCAECIASGIPILYPPRPDFAEAVALERGMESFGLGVALSAERYQQLDFKEAFARANKLRAAAIRPKCDGADVCSEVLMKLWSGATVEDSIESLSGRGRV